MIVLQYKYYVLLIAQYTLKNAGYYCYWYLSSILNIEYVQPAKVFDATAFNRASLKTRNVGCI